MCVCVCVCARGGRLPSRKLKVTTIHPHSYGEGLESRHKHNQPVCQQGGSLAPECDVTKVGTPEVASATCDRRSVRST